MPAPLQTDLTLDELRARLQERVDRLLGKVAPQAEPPPSGAPPPPQTPGDRLADARQAAARTALAPK